MQVPDSGRGRYWKTYRSLLIYSLAFNSTGRNIRTQFLYDNSIFPSIRWPSGFHYSTLSGPGAGHRAAYIPDGPTGNLSRAFYPANGRILLAHIAANKLLTKNLTRLS